MIVEDAVGVDAGDFGEELFVCVGVVETGWGEGHCEEIVFRLEF